MRAPWAFAILVSVVAGVTAAEPPKGYQCGRGGRAVKAKQTCQCPLDKVAARDAADRAICAPRPAPAPTACLAERKGKQKVTIDSTPTGATLYLGDKACGAVGTTPWTGKLYPGPVLVILERFSYEPATQTYVVDGKPRQALTVPLVRTNAGTIDIRADADANVVGAAVALDGEPRGTVPVKLQAKGGRRELRITKDGFVPFVQFVEVVDTQTVVVLPSLVRSTVATGKLVIEADVDAAEVHVDGTLRGRTPVVIDGLPLGSHEVEVKQPPASWTQTVTVTRGQTLIRATLAEQLPRSPTQGTLRVTSKVAGEVVLGGTSAGPTPFVRELPAGEYWVVVRAKGHLPWERRIRLEAEQTVELVAAPAPGSELAITSTPPRASVFVDGTRRGITPLALTLPQGDHVIAVEAPGYQRFERRVKLTGAPHTVDAKLVR